MQNYQKLIICLGLLLCFGFINKPLPKLKKVFKKDFYIGVAINRREANGTDLKGQALIEEHFNCISPENDLKWGLIHPQPGVYNFKSADDYVNFGLKNKMFIVGHTLVWHNQPPAWVLIDENGKQLTREALLARMEEHINAVVGRYKGKINGWDVVNEAFNEDGSMRKSKWLEIIGEDFIEKAFEFAHKADPKAELYYNEYNMFNPQKREGIIRLIKRLQAKNIPIKAVGEQAHYGLQEPQIEQIDRLIIDFAKVGVKVNFTELDISALPNKVKKITAETSKIVNYDSIYNPYKKGLPDSVMLKLAKRYADLFTLFHKHKDKITRVTFWGLTDGDTWLNNWPMPGRTNYPLLFDRNYQIKRPIFEAVIKTVN
jgi:endo-1,4-beta-xylanase